MSRASAVLRIAVTASTALLFVAFYPGGMSIDSYTQLLQGRSGHLGDWHPPFMAWVWGLLDAVLRGPILMLVAQLVLFLLALYCIARAATPCGRTGRSAFVLASIWVLPVSGIVGVVWKDIWTSCFLLIGAAYCLRVDRAGGNWRRTLPIAGAAFLAALLFRPNAVFAVVPLLSYAVWAAGGSRLSARSVIDAAAIGLLATVALGSVAEGVNRSLTTNREHPIQSILIFDVAGISVESGRSDFLDGANATIPDIVRGRSATDPSALRSAYFPSSWTPLVFADGSPLAVTRSGSQVEALGAIWRRAVREEPTAYLAHRAAVFRQVIGAYEGPLFAPVYFDVPADSPDHERVRRAFPQAFAATAPVQQSLRRGLEWSAKAVAYRPWAWLALNLLLLLLLAVMGGHAERRTRLIALGSSGLVYELALFFIAPSADYRYSHWLVLSTWSVLWAAGTGFAAGAFAHNKRTALPLGR